MKLWPFTSAAPAPAASFGSTSDAARVLAKVAADQRAARIATTDALRADVAAGRIAHLGWKQ